MTSLSHVTALVSRMNQGDGSVEPELFELVYDKLRGLASKMLISERNDHTLQPTALVHEAYMRMADGEAIDWRGKARFAAIAARAMRQVLIEHARGKSRKKRGGDWQRITLQGALADEGNHELELIMLDETLSRFAKAYPRAAQAVELRFYANMTMPEMAEVMGVAERTVWTDLQLAKAWITREIDRSRIEGT